MTTISAMILGTADRLKWLEQSLDFMDHQGFPFQQKLVSIYAKTIETVPEWLKPKLELAGWTVVFTDQNRAQAMIDALTQIQTQWVFYNEDDVLVRLPQPEHVKQVLEGWIGDRCCGMLSMNLGGSDHDFPRQKFGDLLDVKQNLQVEFEKYLCFLRDETKRSKWFFEFPALFVRSEILRMVLRPEFGNGGLEIDLTKQYFDLRLDEDFYKASICKKNIYEVIEWYKTNFSMEKFETAKMIRLLDPNQGDAKFKLEDLGEL